MRHDQFDHVIRAAGDILQTETLIVIGSQSLLASFSELPEEATASMEVDILPPGGEDDADTLDWNLGELSPFHESFGIYADGVSPGTATLPDGWEARLVPYGNPNTNGVTARCLEPHDLIAAKLVAGREKDLAFGRAVIRAALVDPEVLRVRIGALPVDVTTRATIDERLARLLRP